jgi:hypothetical protein
MSIFFDNYEMLDQGLFMVDLCALNTLESHLILWLANRLEMKRPAGRSSIEN